MQFRHIHFILNPASGKQEAILSFINNTFKDTGIDWDVTITRKDRSCGDIARSLIGKTDIIAVYGGDGTVTGVAAALQGRDTPLAIIPGGTANVMAKELGIPQDTIAALEMLTSGNYTVKKVDMGLMNDTPFLLRINLGIMADMVLQTDRESKDKLGQLAYAITTLKTIGAAIPVDYTLTIDGDTIQETGVSLTITNSGHIGIGDLALQPGISVTDGLLDVVLANNADFGSLFKIAGSTLFSSETDAIKHWKCKEVTIAMQEPQQFICDDEAMTASTLNIKVVPAAIKIITPTE